MCALEVAVLLFPKYSKSFNLVQQIAEVGIVVIIGASVNLVNHGTTILSHVMSDVTFEVAVVVLRSKKAFFPLKLQCYCYAMGVVDGRGR